MSTRGRRKVDGWLIVDKPLGMTSTAVVNRVRGAFRAAKAGHGGTLDPLATGVLPIAFGAATRAVPYVMGGAKHYRFTLRWGEARDTDDADGQVVATSASRPNEAEIVAALPAFRGELMQVPPAFSAVKVGGERAYDLARSGHPAVLAPRPAHVERFDVIRVLDADRAEFEVVCGKGVYMRSLARDLGRALGTYGHIAELRRLRVGPFDEAAAIPLDKIVAAADSTASSLCHLLPVATALAHIPALSLTETEAASIGRGRALPLAEFAGRLPGEVEGASGLVRTVLGERLLGLGRLDDGWLKLERMFV